jgi:uncharacterized protein
VQAISSGKTGAVQPTEAAFALRRRESDLRLPADRSTEFAWAASVPARSAAPSQKGRSGAPGGQAATRSRSEVSPSAWPSTPKDESEGVSGARVGVISDNHGYLDPAVLAIFAGVVHIIHAGDIVDPKILTALETVAPVTAVGGNMDAGDLAAGLPRAVAAEVGGVRFVVGHKRKRLLKDLAAGKIAGVTEDAPPDLVVYGHDHVPAAAWVDGTLYLNPGSASAPHEEDDWPTVAIVEVRPAGLAVTFVPLEHREVHEGKARPKT